MAEKTGLQVVYGDTDSLFVTYEEKKTRELEKEIEQQLGLDVEQGELYRRIFFTEAKKRYAGLRLDGSLDIVGLEVIRGDWAEVAKKVQEHVLEIILKEQSPTKAADYVQGVINELRQRKVPFRDLIIWKTLTKPVEEYAIKASHVEAARKPEEQRMETDSRRQSGLRHLSLAKDDFTKGSSHMSSHLTTNWTWNITFLSRLCPQRRGFWSFSA